MIENWKKLPFESCIQKVDTKKKIEKRLFQEFGKYPIVSQEEKLISGYWDDDDDVIKLNKPVIVFGDHTKNIKYIDFDFVVGADGVKILCPIDDIDSKFFYYQLKSFNILDLGYARHYRLLKNMKIRYPPLPEQKQIVITIDKIFENLDYIKEIIKKQLENVDKLFKSQLNSFYINNCDNWIQNTLKEITTKIGSGATPSGGNKSYKTTGVSLIRSLNVYDNGFKAENLAYIDNEQAEKLNNVTICENDILINITGASITRCCIAPPDYLPARVNQHVSIIRVKKDNICPEFLHYLLISPNCKNHLLGMGEDGGTTRQALTKKALEELVITYPQSISEQRRIVSEIKEMEKRTLILSKYYSEKLQMIEELQKTILDKAFRGELIR